METLKIIDVTTIEPRRKHPTIFENFDLLSSGEGLIIHNDHDPKPLYYQLLAERGNTFTWAYLEDGPKIWKVEILKFKEGHKESTIGELVKNDFRKAEVFKKYGLDFCCGGKKTVTQVCKSKGLDIVQIEKELKELDTNAVFTSEDYDSWEIGFLADYILNAHHKYVKKAIPLVFEYTQKVSKVHGDKYPETIRIAEKFLLVVDDLNRHMCKEEEVLFPYIKHLSEANNNEMKIEKPAFETIENPIQLMEHEHDVVGKLMEEISELSYHYTPPADACNTFRLAYAKLKEFEDNLHQHIHLENNILFPKAIEFESRLW